MHAGVMPALKKPHEPRSVVHVIEPAVPRSDLFAKCIGQTGEPSASFCFSEHYDEQTIKFFLTEVFYGLGSHESACERRGDHAGIAGTQRSGPPICRRHVVPGYAIWDVRP